MKKKTAIMICAVLTLLLIGCGGSKDYSDYVIGKTFVYENEGFYGDFTISIKDDGTFTYYEGMASSYIGTGEWMIEQDTITLTNEVPTINGTGTYTNIFEIKKGKLIWRTEGSDNFTHVKVKDGESFNEE